MTLRLADLPKIFHSATSSTFVLVTLFNTSLPCSPKNRCVCVHTSAFHSALCQISSQSVPLPSVSAMVSNMGHTYVCPGVAPSKTELALTAKELPNSREADSLSRHHEAPVCSEWPRLCHGCSVSPGTSLPSCRLPHRAQWVSRVMYCFSKGTRFASE